MPRAKIKKKPGRPAEVNTETKNRMIDLLVDGMTLTTVARKLGVARQTLYKWMTSDEAFKEAVKEAREFAAIGLVDEILEIADDDCKDTIADAKGNYRPNTAAVQRSKLRMEARQRLGKYYNPSQFGDKQSVDVTSQGKGIVFSITPPKFEEDEDE